MMRHTEKRMEQLAAIEDERWTDQKWVKVARIYGFDVDQIPEYMYTPTTKKPKPGPICVCLFAGAGGASLGMEQAGFHPAIAVDFEKWCMLTYMTNLGTDKNKPVCFIKKDVRKITGKEILDCLEKMGYERRVDTIWTSPPCQDFSTANSKIPQMACSLDEGSRYCMMESVRLILELRPETFIMENVKGLVSGKLKVLFDAFLERLRKGGYHVDWNVLDAADYGVPQHRERVIAIGQDIQRSLEVKKAVESVLQQMGFEKQ